MQNPLTDEERAGIGLPRWCEVVQGGLHEPKGQHGRMGRLLRSGEDERFEGIGGGGVCQE